MIVLALKWGNYMIAGWGNYVIVSAFRWGNYVIVDIGYGRKLMEQIEQIARDKRLDLIHLDTHGFQGPGFCAKLGYEVFGKLDESPKGYSRYYMVKKL